MNIIWITPELPYPANTGGRIGIMKRIEQLSKNNDIYLFSVIDAEQERKFKSELEKYCKKVFFYNRKSHFLKNILKSIIVPYCCSSRWIKKMKIDIGKLYDNSKIDLIVVDFPQMLGNIRRDIQKTGKIILNQHNIEYITMFDNAKSIDNNIKKMIWMFDAFRLKNIEHMYYKKRTINLYTFVSLSDKAYFEKTFHVENTLLVPVGIEIHDYYGKDTQEGNILFVGKMSYPPNIAAIKWFIHEVWPNVKRYEKKAKLYVVGKDPVPELMNINDEDIIMTGTVEKVDEYYKNASLVIIPLLNGGGVKVKLLEALSYGKKVVTTSKGVEGTNFINGEHLLIANNGRDFFEKCLKVLKNPNDYVQMSEISYKEVCDKYTWERICQMYEKELQTIADKVEE